MKKYLFSLTLLASLAHAVEPIPENEKTARLLEGQKEITSLTEIQKRGLNSGKTTLDLWSGNFWPHYHGLLAARYRDPHFAVLNRPDPTEEQAKAIFKKYKELKTKHPLYAYSGKEDILSPAEKYDLLVGDPQMTLTKYSTKLSDESEMNEWRGICDGWAAAAQKMPRPVKKVTLKTPSGIPVTFYPEDIKALGSLLYARAQDEVIFLGERCTGGMFKSGCKGTNPGTLHRALVNRVGNLGKTFIADVSPGGAVWNYPVESYTLTYYNVFTDEDGATFQDALELFDKKKGFKNADKRHKSTYAIVGVTAVVNYKNMRPANLLDTDGPENDKILTKTYYYDLELDRNMNILGGEPVEKNMPDFIWAPTDTAYPQTVVEKFADGSSTLVKLSQDSAKYGQPLTAIVEKLFEASKK